MRAVAVKDKKPIYTLCSILRIKIEVFNPFKHNFIIYIHRITDTNSIAIRNCCLQVLVHLISLAFKNNKKWDNVAIRANYLCNCNRFTTKHLACFTPYCLIINNKYLLFLALSYMYT